MILFFWGWFLAALAEGQPLKRFSDLYRSESPKVGKAVPEKTIAKIKKAADSMNSSERSVVKNEVLEGRTELDEKFFYLLVLAQTSTAVEDLKEIASSPLRRGALKDRRAIVVRALQGLASLCGNTAARDALMDIENLQSDEDLRDEAHRSLVRWYACKKP